MKKTKKNLLINLTDQELDELLGGSFDQLMEPGDITNANESASCICQYKNTSVILNLNKVGGCQCLCN